VTRLAVLLWLVFAGVVAAQQAANPPRFTGKSDVMDGKDLTAARRHFDAGARTFWHSHDKGQLLLVEQGRMRTQKKGGPVREFGVGESDYAGPNVVHWHGATGDQPLVQINVGFGGETKWMEQVTDAEYTKR
jgi:quercetin dioxygenase-like cupin family protein